MKRFFSVVLLALLCQTAAAQTADGPKVAIDAQPQRIPGVDVCGLFTIQELRALTAFDLEETWDHNPDVPTLVYGSDHYPEENGGRPELGEHTYGTADIPYNGRECMYRTSLGHEEPAGVSFRAYEGTKEDIRAHWPTSESRFVRSNVLEINKQCFVEISGIDVWIGITVVAPPLNRDETADISCRIALDGNVALRALTVKRDLIPVE